MRKKSEQASGERSKRLKLRKKQWELVYNPMTFGHNIALSFLFLLFSSIALSLKGLHHHLKTPAVFVIWLYSKMACCRIIKQEKVKWSSWAEACCSLLPEESGIFICSIQIHHRLPSQCGLILSCRNKTSPLRSFHLCLILSDCEWFYLPWGTLLNAVFYATWNCIKYKDIGLQPKFSLPSCFLPLSVPSLTRCINMWEFV